MKDRENAKDNACQNRHEERKAEHDGVERDLVQPRQALWSEFNQELYPELGEPEPEQAAEQPERETLRERLQCEPSAVRTATSRSEDSARTRKRFATFAQAIKNTSPTVPRSTQSTFPTSPTTSFLSGWTLGPSFASRSSVFGEVLSREYSDFRYAAVHQLTVDTYAVQHPGTPSPQSIQSVAVHLMSLHLMLERGYASRQATKAIQRATSLDDVFEWLDPPDSLGALTSEHVHAARGAAAHQERVREWAAAVWNAWDRYHETVRRWAKLPEIS